jgi:hypothetical protein
LTRHEWRGGTNLYRMLRFLRGKASDSQVRLFGCACCRLVWDCLPGPNTCKAVRVAEEYAEGLVSRDQLEAAGREALEDDGESRFFNYHWLTRAGGENMLNNACGYSFRLAGLHALAQGRSVSKVNAAHARIISAQRDLLRDLFTPFESPTLDPVCLTWSDGLVTKLAEAIRLEHAFDRMPILGDALEDAGCTDDAILNHCRQAPRHARGCWVLQLIRSSSAP